MMCWFIIVFGFFLFFGENTSEIELSCSDVVRSKVYSVDNATDANFHLELKDEACTFRWFIQGPSNRCPVAIQCYGKLPEDPEFVVFDVSDKNKGKYNPCGEFNFTMRPNGYELFVSIETKQGYAGGGFVNCLVICDLQDEHKRLPVVHVNRHRPYYKTNNISQDFHAVEFHWPLKRHKEVGFWSIVGSGNCTVGIQCTLNVSGDFDQSDLYVKVSDGSKGEQVFCGNLSFEVAPSDPKLRDMFLKVNDLKDASVIQLNCNAQCIQDAVFSKLSNTLERKTDLRCVCGLHNKDDRIIGGEIATMNEFPWQVALARKNSRMEFCGGTVINDRMVLTAKHCVTTFDSFLDETEVLVHAHNLAQKPPPGLPEFEVFESFQEMYAFPIHTSVLEADKLEKTQRIRIADVIIPDLEPVLHDYDIALLRLETKIDLGEPNGPTPVCLPPPDEHATYTDDFRENDLKVTGWGITETGNQSEYLKKANVFYVANDECEKGYREKTGSNRKALTPRMMCAYIQKEDSINDGVCFGDSGGPLTFKNEINQAVQVGVISFVAMGCPANGTIAVNAKISELMQWIEFYSNEWKSKWCQRRNEK